MSNDPIVYKNGKPNKLQREFMARTEEVEHLFKYTVRNYGIELADIMSAGFDSLDDMYQQYWLGCLRNLRDKKKWPCAFSTFCCRWVWYVMGHQRRHLSGMKWRMDNLPTVDGDVAIEIMRSNEPAVDTTVDTELLLHEILRFLDDRSRQVVELRLGLRDGHQMHWKVIGQMFGVTAERARQVFENAVSKLATDHNFKLLAESIGMEVA